MVESGKVEVGQSYEDYLMKKGREYEANRQELQLRKDMADAEAEACTFQPTVYMRKGQEHYSSARYNNDSGSKWE